MNPAPPIFLVDENLRGLTRWLRFLGFNTVSAEGENDRQLALRAINEKRILLTRDRELAASLGDERARYLRAQRTPDQLRELFSFYSWPEEGLWFSRCTLCNRELREVSAGAKGLPPEYARGWACDGCGRLYWRGSHYQRTRAYFDRLQSGQRKA